MEMIANGTGCHNERSSIFARANYFKNLYEYVAKGKKPEKFIPLPIIPITKENLSEAISWEISDENYERAVEYIGGIDD